MRWQLPLDPVTSVQLELRIQRLQAEYCLSSEAANALRDRAWAILEARIHPTTSACDPSIDPENWCQGILPIIVSTVSQACLDASQAMKTLVSSRN